MKLATFMLIATFALSGNVVRADDAETTEEAPVAEETNHPSGDVETLAGQDAEEATKPTKTPSKKAMHKKKLAKKKHAHKKKTKNT